MNVRGLDEVLAVTTRVRKGGEVHPITPEDIEAIKRPTYVWLSRPCALLSVAYRDIDSVPATIGRQRGERAGLRGLLGMIDPASGSHQAVKNAVRRASVP